MVIVLLVLAKNHASNYIRTNKNDEYYDCVWNKNNKKQCKPSVLGDYTSVVECNEVCAKDTEEFTSNFPRYRYKCLLSKDYEQGSFGNECILTGDGIYKTYAQCAASTHCKDAPVFRKHTKLQLTADTDICLLAENGEYTDINHCNLNTNSNQTQTRFYFERAFDVDGNPRCQPTANKQTNFMEFNNCMTNIYDELDPLRNQSATKRYVVAGVYQEGMSQGLRDLNNQPIRINKCIEMDVDSTSTQNVNNYFGAQSIFNNHNDCKNYAAQEQHYYYLDAVKSCIAVDDSNIVPTTNTVFYTGDPSLPYTDVNSTYQKYSLCVQNKTE